MAEDEGHVICPSIDAVYLSQLRRIIHTATYHVSDISPGSAQRLLDKLDQGGDDQVSQRIGVVKRCLDLVLCLEGKPGSSNIVPGGTRIRKPNRRDMESSQRMEARYSRMVQQQQQEAKHDKTPILDWFDYTLGLLTVSFYDRDQIFLQNSSVICANVSHPSNFTKWVRSVLSRNRKGYPLWCGDVSLDGPILTVIRDSITRQGAPESARLDDENKASSRSIQLAKLGEVISSKFRRRLSGHIDLLTLMSFVEAYPQFQVISASTKSEVSVTKVLQGYCECGAPHKPAVTSRYQRRHLSQVCSRTLSKLNVRFRRWIRKTQLYKSQLSFVAADMPNEGFVSSAWSGYAVDSEDHTACFSNDYSRATEDTNELSRIRSRYRRPFANNFSELLLPQHISEYVASVSSTAQSETWKVMRLQHYFASLAFYCSQYVGRSISVTLSEGKYNVASVLVMNSFLAEAYDKSSGIEIPLQTFPFATLNRMVDFIFQEKWLTTAGNHSSDHLLKLCQYRKEDNSKLMCCCVSRVGDSPTLTQDVASESLAQSMSTIKGLQTFPLEKNKDDIDWRVYLLLVYCAVTKLASENSKDGIGVKLRLRQLRGYLNDRKIKCPGSLPGVREDLVKSLTFTFIMDSLPFVELHQEQKPYTVELKQQPLRLGRDLNIMLEASSDETQLRHAVYSELPNDDKQVIEEWFQTLCRQLLLLSTPLFQDKHNIENVKKVALERVRNIDARGGEPLFLDDIGASSVVLVTLVQSLENSEARTWLKLSSVEETLQGSCRITFPRDRKLADFIHNYCHRRLEICEEKNEAFVRSRPLHFSSDSATFLPGEISVKPPMGEQDVLDTFCGFLRKLRLDGSHGVFIESLLSLALGGELDMNAWANVYEWVTQQPWCHLSFPTKSFCSASVVLFSEHALSSVPQSFREVGRGSGGEPNATYEGGHATEQTVLSSTGLPSRYYIYGEGVGIEEDLHHEFKGGFTGGVHKAILNIAPRYVVAYLNASGGTLYFGITNEGTVHGVKLCRADKDAINLAKDSIAQRIGPQGVLYLIDHPVFMPLFRRLSHASQDGSYFEGLPNTYVIELNVSASPNPSVLHYEIRSNVPKRSGKDIKDSAYVYWVRQAASVRAMSDPQEIAEWAFGRGRTYGGATDRHSLHISRLNEAPTSLPGNSTLQETSTTTNAETKSSLPLSPDESNPQYREVDIALAPEHGVAWQVPSDKRLKDSFGSNTVLTLRLSQTPLKNGVGLVVESLGGILCKTQIICSGALLLEVNGESVEKLRLNKIRKILAPGKIRRLRFLSPLPRES
eukprot:gb/GECG01011902.1/.p1 GENE.gb/GECG01011902.1/~~gb/GECG01011902.1/.p1  ORF type:complete len:1299 (+),score=147.16 gb/GECG01011902.1/:1-3897(+)